MAKLKDQNIKSDKIIGERNNVTKINNTILSERYLSKITVGSTETLEPTEPAQVIETGDVSEKVLNFKIPRGLKGDSGKDGKDGQDGAEGEKGHDLEYRYKVGTSTTVAPEIDRFKRVPEGWSDEVPNISQGMYLWEVKAMINSKNDLVNKWSRSYRSTGEKGDKGNNGIDGEDGMDGVDGEDGKSGATLNPRGDWSNSEQYSGTELVVEFVKYNNKGYLTRIDAGDIPIGTVPTDTDYWNEITDNPDSIFTDFLVAVSAAIENLTVGTIQTGADGERTTIGYKPDDSSDPTSDYSKHSIRGYYPSGRVMVAFSYIPEEEPLTFEGVEFKDTFAIIFYKDESGSPVGFVLSGKSLTSESIIEANKLEVKDGGRVGKWDIGKFEGDSYTKLKTQGAFGGLDSPDYVNEIGAELNPFGLLINRTRYLNDQFPTPTEPNYWIRADISGDAILDIKSRSNQTALKINGKIEIGNEEGFTGTINGAEFVNGICVGQA